MMDMMGKERYLWRIMVGIEHYYTRLATRWNLCGQDFPRKGHYLVIFTAQDLLPYGDMQQTTQLSKF